MSAVSVARGRCSLVCLLMLAAVPAQAHEGPPFPIIVDQRRGDHLVSIWTDPDVGTGLVYVVVEAAPGAAYVPPSSVRVGVQPVSGRLPERLYDAMSEPARRGGRYVTQVQLDRQELWRIRAILDGRGGTAVTADVEATPAGSIGPIGLVLYALPFLALAGVWLRVAIVRRRMSAEDLPPKARDPRA